MASTNNSIRNSIYSDILNYPICSFKSKDNTVYNFRVIPNQNISEFLEETNNDNFENNPAAVSSINYAENDDLYEDDYFDEDREELKLKELDRGFLYDLVIPRNLYRAIIGKNGSTLRKLQLDTNVTINIPEEDDKKQAIEIIGILPWNIERCLGLIEVLLIEERNKQPFSHFFSIPMNNQTIINNFVQFKKEVLELLNNEIEETIFQNPYKLHLTIGTLVLMNENEEKAAIDALNNFKSDCLCNLITKKEEIEVKGIDYMNDDPSEVDILFANAKFKNPNSRITLQTLCDELIRYFSNQGLMYEKYDKVKLHITLMNTLFRIDEQQQRKTFDATKILKTFSNYYFGVQHLNEIHISVRKSTHLKSGYYKPLYVLHL